MTHLYRLVQIHQMLQINKITREKSMKKNYNIGQRQ